MGWFSKRKSAPDAISDICRSLVEKPYEWTTGQTKEKPPTPTLTHISGVFVGWNKTGRIYENDALKVFIGFSGSGSEYVSVTESRRLMAAIHGNAAARVTRPRVSFDEATKAVARAVLDGDKEAAYQLADWVMEHCGGTKGAA